MKICKVEGCIKPIYVKHLCTTHYKRQWRHGDANQTAFPDAGKACEVENCEEPRRAHGLCNIHYMRMYHRGTTEAKNRPRGGGTINAAGYRVFRINGKQVYEHTLVAEKALGRKLPPGAVVHHVNNDPADNRPSNLVICPDQAYHLLLHRRMKDLGYE